MSIASLRAPAVLSLVLVLVACGARQERFERHREGSSLITAEQIERSGATDAWDALRRSGASLRMREGRRGEPSSLNRRGRASLLLDDAPLLVVDGARMADFQYLRHIPARAILSIRIMNGIDGTRAFSTGAGGGAIVVLTRSGPGL